MERKLFLVGRIRYYEGLLFGRGAFSRFMENSDAAGFIRELKDTRYGNYIDEEKELGRACARYIEDVFRDFRKDMGKEGLMLDAFMISYDAGRYIDIIKKSGPEEGERRIFPLDSNSPAVVKRARKIIEKSEGLSDREVEKAFVDAAADEYLPLFTSRPLKELWMSLVDIKNFLNNLRHTSPGLYFKGGYIEPSFWEAADSRSEVPAKLKGRPFMQALAREEDTENYERLLWDWTAKRLKELRKITFGPEPVCSFLMTLVKESENLQAVYAGLSMGLGSEVIRENLFYSYA